MLHFMRVRGVFVVCSTRPRFDPLLLFALLIQTQHFLLKKPIKAQIKGLQHFSGKKNPSILSKAVILKQTKKKKLVKNLVWPVLSYVTTVEWRPCDSGSALAFSVILQDPHSLQLTCTDILSINVINCGFVVLVCTCDIYCMSVCPGRGISPLWLILRFLPSIYFWVSFQYGKFFLTQIEGLITDDAVHCTDC